MGKAASELLTALLQAREPVLLTGPVEPDGDSLGACLALQRVLRAKGRRVDVAGHAAHRYQGLPGVSELVPDEAVRPIYGAVVVLDGDRHRLHPSTEAAFEAAPVKAIIDHHASTRPDGYTVRWLDPAATSTTEMLYWALDEWSVPLDPELAELLYVGAIFDTGAFRYSNTTPATHRMAAALLATGIDHASLCTRILMERRESGIRLAGEVYSTLDLLQDGQLALGVVTLDDMQQQGGVGSDLEGLVDSLVFVRGVEVAVLLIERSDTVKASLRSRGRVDVARLAQQLSPTGGGHAKAAGASLSGPVQAAKQQIIGVVGAALAAIP